jgi:hypothetical protein
LVAAAVGDAGDGFDAVSTIRAAASFSWSRRVQQLAVQPRVLVGARVWSESRSNGWSGCPVDDLAGSIRVVAR